MEATATPQCLHDDFDVVNLTPTADGFKTKQMLQMKCNTCSKILATRDQKHGMYHVAILDWDWAKRDDRINQLGVN